MNAGTKPRSIRQGDGVGAGETSSVGQGDEANSGRAFVAIVGTETTETKAGKATKAKKASN